MRILGSGDAVGVRGHFVTSTSLATALGTAFLGCLLLVASSMLLTVAGIPAGSLEAAAAAEGEGCPNAAVRTGYAAYLPECRGYELVSPPEVEPFFEVSGQPGNLIEGGQRLTGGAWGVVAASSGDRLGFFSTYTPTIATSDGPYYRSSRGPDGWTTENVIPPQSVSNTGRTCFNAYIVAYTPDLSKGVLADGSGQQEGSNCGTDEPLLVPGEPLGVQNLFESAGAGGPHDLINVTPLSAIPANAWFQASSADLSQVAFDEPAQLTTDAPPGDNLYVWAKGGGVRLATFLPDGTPAQGELANADQPFSFGVGPGAEVFTHAMSTDGSRIFFVVGGNLYVREHATLQQSPLDGEGHCTDQALACTIQVDASQAGGSGGGGSFKWASADGSQVFFEDDAERGLTADTIPGSGQNLYRYDVATGTLTDLTPGGEARVDGVSGVSEDGSHVYFVAEGAFAPGAVGGEPNLYLVRGTGAPSFIATLDNANDSLDWASTFLTARISPSGAYLAFNSTKSLTGYDNTDVNTGEPDQEVYLFEAGAGSLRCASCDPSGARPAAPTRIHQPAYDLLFEFTPGRPQRNVTDNGQVFFDTTNAVLPRDVNGQSDVYEYDSGRTSLISSGAGSVPSYFYEADASGANLFFFTSQALVPQDADGGVSVYDARVGGGFPASSPPPSCSGDACKAPPSIPPNPPAIGSGTLSTSGNLPPAAPPPALAKPKVVGVKLRAQKLVVRLKAPGRGRISASGTGLKSLSRSVDKAGTYTIMLRLGPKSQAALRKKRRLRVTLRLAFASVSGQSSSVLTTLTARR